MFVSVFRVVNYRLVSVDGETRFPVIVCSRMSFPVLSSPLGWFLCRCLCDGGETGRVDQEGGGRGVSMGGEMEFMGFKGVVDTLVSLVSSRGVVVVYSGCGVLNPGRIVVLTRSPLRRVLFVGYSLSSLLEGVDRGSFSVLERVGVRVLELNRRVDRINGELKIVTCQDWD